MILGIGTDIVDIERFRNSRTHMDNLAKRICTDFELEEYFANIDELKSLYLAKKWAAKEAVAKAFGTGIQGDTRFKSIEIRHNTNGKPVVCFNDKLRQTIESLRARCHISLSDTDTSVVAYSVIEYDVNPQHDWATENSQK